MAWGLFANISPFLPSRTRSIPSVPIPSGLARPYCPIWTVWCARSFSGAGGRHGTRRPLELHHGLQAAPAVWGFQRRAGAHAPPQRLHNRQAQAAAFTVGVLRQAIKALENALPNGGGDAGPI